MVEMITDRRKNHRIDNSHFPDLRVPNPPAFPLRVERHIHCDKKSRVNAKRDAGDKPLQAIKMLHVVIEE